MRQVRDILQIDACRWKKREWAQLAERDTGSTILALASTPTFSSRTGSIWMFCPILLKRI